MSQETPGISIITPFFNTGPVFWDTYASILNQSFTNWEWLIINDGSDNEGSLAILKELHNAGNPKIRVINLEKNLGLPAARNRGISQAKNEFLAFIDSDDLFDPLALEKFYLVLKNNSHIEFVNSYVTGFDGQDYKWRGGFHEGSVFLKENRNTSCFLGRKGVFDWVQFDENLRDGGEDWDFWLHAASKGYWGHTIPEFLTLYRRKKGKSDWKVLSSGEELEKYRMTLLKKYGGSLTKHNFPQRNLATYSFEKTILEVLPPANRNPEHSKNILFILPWLEVGGADKFNLDLVEGLTKRDWKITIACTKAGDQPWEDLFKKHTSDIFYFPNYADESGYFKIFEHFIISRKPDIIFLSNSTHGYYIIPFIRLRFPHIPVVDYLHCEDTGWFNGGYPTFSSIFTGVINRTFVSSKHLKNWSIEKGVIPEKISVIYTNVNTNEVARNLESRMKIRSTHNIPDNIPVILYVARLTEQKQPLVLLAAIEILFSKTKDFKLLVIGDGPDRDLFLKSLKKNKAKNNIIYLGAQPNNRVKEYMDAADIFFLPTAFEGIALSIFEAMAKELPVVAAKVGGQAELVTDGCGFLIQRSNPQQEAAAYADHLFHMTRYSEVRIEAGKRSRERVQKFFQLESMITGIETELIEIIKQHHASVPAVASEYVGVMNRMLYMDQEAAKMKDQLNNPIIRILKKYKKEYRIAKKLVHKIKSKTNKPS